METAKHILKPSLQKRLDRMDTELADLFEVLNKYSDDDLNWKPKADQWSVLQVMVHLMKAEAGSQAYVEKKLSSGHSHLSKAGILAGSRKHIMNCILRFPFKIKAPKGFGTENLPDRSSFWDLVKQWKKQREDLRNYLASLPNEALSKEIYKHPVAGRMSVNGMLSFFEVHFKRHRKQIDRVLQNYRY